MRMTLTTTIAALAALAWLSPETPAAAQETTAREALERLRRAERPDYTSAVRILRQVDGPRTAAELDAFADQAAAVAADATLPEDVRWEATLTLLSAASADGEGMPYPRARAFDLLVEVYEGGYDHALRTLMRADSVRGLAYMRELFGRSERPPLCRQYGLVFSSLYPGPPECEGYRDTPWCKAGRYLFGDVAREAHEANEARVARFMRIAREEGVFIDIVPEGMPEDVEDWYLRCYQP